jgi:hypothetical protein
LPFSKLNNYLFVRSILLALLLIVGFGLLLNSCKKDSIDKNPSSKLSFSNDSVYFDTVFVSLGSVTQRFMVYNPNEKTIKISKIKLAGGSNSPFRINVDGISSTEVTDVEIEGKDSIFIFAEVTIDPNNPNNYFIVKDSIQFETNGNLQDVKLVAYGRNADFYRPTVFPTNGLPAYSIVSCDAVWTSEKPKVVIGYLLVDSACTLTIEHGTQVYMYNNSGLWVYKGGRLKIEGTREDSVVFQGVRKETDYQNIPGQWDRIWINQSSGNSINYAVIKNGNIGIQAENLYELGESPTTSINLSLTNTRIKNMKAYGLYGVNYNISANNDVISNCGSYAMVLINGGNYDFTHCTIGNYWNASIRSDPAVILTNYKTASDNTELVRSMDFRFKNGIVYGNIQNGNELEVYSKPAPVGFNWKFENSVLKIDNEDINTNDANHFSSMIFNSDPLFVDAVEQNYKLYSASPARNIGNVNFATSIPEDLLGNNRLADGLPDAGAYEFVP